MNTELEELKEKATQLGIKFHPKTGVKKLQAKINAVENPVEEIEEEIVVEPEVVKSLKQTKKVITTTVEEIVPVVPQPPTRAEILETRKKKASQLVRIRLTCMNPNKKDWPGEIFSAGSAKIGRFKKFVPFTANDGWHVPRILFNMIKERQFSTFYTEKTPKGMKVTKSKLMPEFAVEELPPLTPEEIKELAQRQAMSGSVG